MVVIEDLLQLKDLILFLQDLAVLALLDVHINQDRHTGLLQDQLHQDMEGVGALQEDLDTVLVVLVEEDVDNYFFLDFLFLLEEG